MLENIKSNYLIQYIFSLLNQKRKFKLVIYNKNIQNKLDINLIDYKNGCKLDGTCGNAKRSCDSIVYNVLEDECHELITSDSDKKCVYYESGGRGICNAEYISCKFYSSSPTCNNNHHPLIEKDNKYYLDLSKVCTYDSTETGTEKCKAEYVYCSAYTGDDKTVCPNLKVSDSTTKRCVYDPTSTSRICKEDYLSCNVYNDMITSKSRRVCESIILDDSSKKCIYINEIDKCIQTELFSTCDGYKGIDKYICESIITPTNHSKCYLEKDRTCKERMFNCSEVITEEDCLYYAKPVDSRKKCVYSSGKCYEEYQRCEDYSPLDETVSGCSSIIMHNGKKCYLDSTGLCRTKNKTCDDSYSNEDECNLIAQSGVSDPDKKVCDYFSGYCKENYKYCSDYRGNNDNNKCTNIKPYDDSGNNIDRVFKCKYTNGVGCEKISKACSEANGNPILCSLISPNIRDNNIKYCFYDGTNCIEQYKACENITSTDSTCTDNIPQNYLTRHCKVDNGKCISKTTCEEFNNINYNYNKYLCEDNCLVQNQYKLIETNELECIEDFPIIDFFNQKLMINSNMNIKDIVNIISNIKMEIKNGALDSLINNIYEKEEDSIIENINIIFQLTSSNNQKTKEYKNLSSINLGECENILKEKYNITKNISLLLFKIDYKIKELNIPIIKFEVFNPINKEQLNLDFCKEKKINFDIDIPVSIKEDNLFKYDPNGDYYNNICFTYSSDKGADIILKDRKKEYNKNNMSLCEKNCNFKGYNQKTKKAICECNLNDKALLSLEDVINKEKLLNNFIDIKSTTNLLVMKCYLLLFSKKTIFINIGIYIFLIIIIIHIISMVIFYIKGYPLIYHEVTNIIEKKKNKISKNEECDKKESINITIEGNNMNKNNLQKIKAYRNDNDIINKIDNNTNNQNNNSIQIYENRIKNIDYEMNDFSYKEAVDNDKRSFFEYFIFLIKTKHWLVLWFYSNTIYNPIMIKICLFTFSFALYYAINTLFFDDATMNKIYENEGVFNFVYLLPKIIYSTIISSLIMIIIKKLAVIETEIIEFKKNNDIKECENKLPKLIKCIKIKFICFFALSSIFLILFSYYVSCFCAVYKNTQIILIKDTLISFGLHLLCPFIFYAISSIIRIFSVQKPENFLEFFYETSKLL